MTVLTRGPGAVVIRAQRRFRARRHAGSRRWARRWGVAGVIVAVLAGGGFWVAHSPLLALHYVTVEGTSRLTPAQVVAAAAVREGTSLVTLDPGAIARRVERLPAVASARVHRRWPHGLVIAVTERTPAGVVVDASGATLLDASGVAFATVPTAPSGLVRVTVSAPVPGLGADAARAAMQVLGELPGALRRQVRAVDAPSADDVSVRLSNGRTVVWGSPADGATKAEVLRLLLRHPAHEYDVSTPAVAVTRG